MNLVNPKFKENFVECKYNKCHYCNYLRLELSNTIFHSKGGVENGNNNDSNECQNCVSPLQVLYLAAPSDCKLSRKTIY